MPQIKQSFTSAYLAGELDGFLDCPRPPALLDEPAPVHPELPELLRREAARLGAAPAVLERAESLARPGARTAVTGQQAGLLLGPLFTLSKTAAARAVAAETSTDDRPVVPVFWLASQDHDVAEVDHTWLLDMAGDLQRISLDLPAGRPVSDIPFSPAWPDRIMEQIGAGSWPDEGIREVRDSLNAAAGLAGNWADFFTALFYRAHGPDAPPVIDPSVPDIAALFSDVLAMELADPLAGPAAINAAGIRLRHLGHQPQLGRGEGATNLFLTETEDGTAQRHLLRFEGGKFHSGTRAWSRPDLLNMLRDEPGRITPAAGLRPAVQDAVLGTAAFIVGPGELRYIAQLREVYARLGVRQPAVWPRTSVTVTEPHVARILASLGTSAAEFLEDPDAVTERLLQRRAGSHDAFVKVLHGLEAQTRELADLVADIDPTLQKTVERYRERVAASTGQLMGRTGRALARRDGVLMSQTERLRTALLPGGTHQERVLSPYSFFLKYGTESVMRQFRDLPSGGQVTLGI